MDETYNLIVVGCGGAGLSAAVSYAEASRAAGWEASIAVLERSTVAMRGGSTRWTGAGMLIDEKFALDPAFTEWMASVSNGLADPDFCDVLVAESANTGTFLAERGVTFIPIQQVWEGETKVYHHPDGGGLAIVDNLARTLGEHRGAAIFYETEAVRLSVSEAGRVDGVVVRGTDGLLRTIHGDAVVLACGGFEGNYEMLTQYVGKNAVDLLKLAPGTQFNKGDGIRMACEIGAATAGQFDGMHAELVDIRTDHPDAVLYGHTWPIVVNGDAKRFWDEGAKKMGESFEVIAYEVWEHQDQRAFFITDDLVMSNDALTARFDTDLPPVRADSIRELAVALGLDPDALEATVTEFNAACSDTPFDPDRLDGKGTVGIEPPKSNWANPINHPPYYGYPVAAAICFTFGGVKTDTSARVLSTAGVPIPGLYAAGELVGTYYHEYIGATSVLKACTFGRIAGTLAAQLALDATVAQSR